VGGCIISQLIFGYVFNIALAQETEVKSLLNLCNNNNQLNWYFVDIFLYIMPKV
jgi:hypothetical protein